MFLSQKTYHCVEVAFLIVDLPHWIMILLGQGLGGLVHTVSQAPSMVLGSLYQMTSAVA